MVGLFHGKSHLEMDDCLEYPYFRKPAYKEMMMDSGDLGHSVVVLGLSDNGTEITERLRLAGHRIK